MTFPVNPTQGESYADEYNSIWEYHGTKWHRKVVTNPNDTLYPVRLLSSGGPTADPILGGGGENNQNTADAPQKWSREATNTTILTASGAQFGVNSIKAIGNGDQTYNIVSLPGLTNIYVNVPIAGTTVSDQSYVTENGAVNAMNALFTVTPLAGGGDYVPVFPSSDAVEVVGYSQAEVKVPITEKEPGVPHLQAASARSGHDSRFWTDQVINQPGEYYEVRITNSGRFLLGLGRVDNGDRDAMANDTGTAASGVYLSQAFYNYGAYHAPWTYYGLVSSEGRTGQGWTGPVDKQYRYNQIVQGFHNTDPNGFGILFRIGIRDDGRFYCAYYDEGRSNEFIETMYSGSTLPGGDYFLVVKLWDGSSTLVELPKRAATDPAAPVLNWRYIESPDGSFSYPLFATVEEAVYVDQQAGGGGTYHTHVYPDDPSSTTWYVPTTLDTHDAPAAPAVTTERPYVEIPTLADEQFGPAAFDLADVTVDELSNVTYNVKPVGQDTYTTTVTGLPAGLAYDGLFSVSGSAPEVSGDTQSNPSDQYTITVTRTNAYGSTSDQHVLTVTNLTQPVTPVTGFTFVAGTTPLVDSDTLADGSAVTLNNVLDDGNRIIIPGTWVEQFVLPAISGPGDCVYLGRRTGNLGNGIADGDFGDYIKWAYNDVNQVRSTIYAGGASQETVVFSATDSFYDYGIELDGSQLHILAEAETSNDMVSEPTVDNGGTFNRRVTRNGFTSGGSVTLTLAVKGSTMDIGTTGLNEFEPADPPVSIVTPWTKALDFSGSAERTQQVSTNFSYNPVMMNGVSSQVPMPAAGAGNTATSSTAQPWATAMVFKPDYNTSNQHIWNVGEGNVSSSSDNIYVRLSSGGALYFGWGRSGELNECYIGSIFNQIQNNEWIGLYVAHNGARFNASNATPANLLSAFDIRLFGESTTYYSGNPGVWTPGTNISNQWGSNLSQTGARMDRQVSGATTIGGRGANRSYHGKVASMVITTLRRGQPMPGDAEIKAMVTDPVAWLQTYKVGQPYRLPYSSAEFSFSFNDSGSAYGTQVWLMGDTVSDGFAQIRNRVYPAIQNIYPLNMISMVSNDIQNVTIPGLS